MIVTGITPSLIVGNTTSPMNAGNVKNSGFEFELSWRDHIKDFSYSVKANIATLKNKVTYLHETLERIASTTTDITNEYDPVLRAVLFFMLTL